MDENYDNDDDLTEIIKAIGDNLDAMFREYTEVYVKRLIKEAENNNEQARVLLEAIARQFREISESFNGLAESMISKQLH